MGLVCVEFDSKQRKTQETSRCVIKPITRHRRKTGGKQVHHCDCGLVHRGRHGKNIGEENRGFWANE